MIKTEGEIIDVKPENGKFYTLKELQGFVGGLIELIEFNGTTMVVNEEGKVKDLDANPLATAIYRKNCRTTDYIAGDALLCESTQIR